MPVFLNVSLEALALGLTLPVSVCTHRETWHPNRTNPRARDVMGEQGKEEGSKTHTKKCLSIYFHSLCPLTRDVLVYNLKKGKENKSIRRLVGIIKTEKSPKMSCQNYCDCVLLFSHSVTLYSASPHLFMHFIFFFTQSFCLLSLSSSPTLSKWSAAEFIICSGNGVFWLMTWPLGPVLPGKKISVWAPAYACMCVFVFLSLWELLGF